MLEVRAVVPVVLVGGVARLWHEPRLVEGVRDGEAGAREDGRLAVLLPPPISVLRGTAAAATAAAAGGAASSSSSSFSSAATARRRCLAPAPPAGLPRRLRTTPLVVARLALGRLAPPAVVAQGAAI